MLKRYLLACCCCLVGAGVPFAASPVVSTAASRTPAHLGEVPVHAGENRANVIFDDSTRPPDPSVGRGAKARPAAWFKLPLTPRTAAGVALPSAAGSSSSAPPDPEVLGFAQCGEVDSGAWQADFKLNLLTTIAYAFVNINGNGSLVENDCGWVGLRSSSGTQMIDAAHAAGDRVVVSISDHGTCGSCGNTLLGNSGYIQNFVNNLVYLVASRGIDGVNLDFENATDTSGFTTMVEELRAAMDRQIPLSAYLSVDAFGSAYQGGELWNLPALTPYVDAIMPMAYDLNFGNTLPNAPLNPNSAYAYTDVGIVDGFLADGVPAHELLLGVPYYGYVYSTTSNVFNAPRGGDDDVSAVTYAGALVDFSCTSGPPDNLVQNWAPSAASPWASWSSPSSGDPCGANHGSYRELYYDNAQSLIDKYAFVNHEGLRGIGIWALGYDSGSNDLWNALAQSFSVSHGPVPQTFVVPSAGDPVSVLTPDHSQQLEFWRGPSDNHLYEIWYTFSVAHWFGPEDLTSSLFSNQGLLQSQPRALFTPGGGQQLVFWEGTNGHLWEAWYSVASHRWSIADLTAAHFPSAASVASEPEVIFTPGGGQQLVFWQGTDGHLWEAWYTVATARWASADLSTGPLGSVRGLESLASLPSVVTTPNGGQQLAFWQGSADGHLWEAWYTVGTARWSAEDLTASRLAGNGKLASSPSVVTTPNGGQQLVFWQGTDDQLWEAWYTVTAGRWAISSQNVGATVAASPDPLFNATQQLVFWRGTNAHVFEAWTNPATGAWAHQDLSATAALPGGAATAGPPSAVVLPNGEQQVWWQGSSSSLWELRYVDGWFYHDWSTP